MLCLFGKGRSQADSGVLRGAFREIGPLLVTSVRAFGTNGFFASVMRKSTPTHHSPASPPTDVVSMRKSPMRCSKCPDSSFCHPTGTTWKPGSHDDSRRANKPVHDVTRRMTRLALTRYIRKFVFNCEHFFA